MTARRGSAQDERRPPWWRFAAPAVLVLGMVLCAAALQRMVARETIVLDPRGLPLAAAIAAVVAVLVFGGIAWRALLHSASGERLSVRAAVAQFGLLIVGKYVPGGVTGVLARVAANAGHVPPRAVLLATVLEQAGSVVVGAMVVAIVLAIRRGAVTTTALVAALLVAAWAAPRCLRAIARRWARAAAWLEQLERVDARGLAAGCGAYVAQWLALMALAISVSAMAVPGLGAATAVDLAVAYAIAMLAGIVALVFPGGLGPREAVFTWFAAGAIGAETALGIALAMRIATIAIDLLGGLAYVGFRLTAPRAP